MFGEGSGERKFMDGLMLDIFEFGLSQIFFGEVAKGTVRVSRGELIFPWSIGFVILFA